MRLFLAADLDEGARAWAAAEVDAMARRLERGPSEPRVGWVRPENLHLTIRFLGHVSDEIGGALVEAFDATLDAPAFDATLAGAGVFPERGQPRVVWIAVSEGAAEFGALHAAVEERLRPLGFAPEGRPFVAHLTLGRVREAGRGGAAVIRDAVTRAARTPVVWRVGHVTLYESRLSPKGPTYTARTRARLT